MILTRYESTSDGAFGILEVRGKVYHTVEKPWDNNQPFKSCIPAGEYTLVPHSSLKYGEVLCMVNEEIGVTHWQDVNSKRYACLIHPANYAKDVEGCVGLGRSRWESMVVKSKQATARFYSAVDPTEEHKLIIQWGER